jgi:hypothetical protein
VPTAIRDSVERGDRIDRYQTLSTVADDSRNARDRNGRHRSIGFYGSSVVNQSPVASAFRRKIPWLSLLSTELGQRGRQPPAFHLKVEATGIGFFTRLDLRPRTVSGAIDSSHGRPYAQYT